MTGVLGEEWLSSVFLRHCGPDRPRLLILDGHSSHETLGLLEKAKEHSIYLLALPPHTSHCLPPMDKCVFGNLKSAYNEACTTYIPQDPHSIINKRHMTNMAYVKTFSCLHFLPNLQLAQVCHLTPPTILSNHIPLKWQFNLNLVFQQPWQAYWMDGWIRLIVGFQPLMVISPTASCWCVCTGPVLY